MAATEGWPLSSREGSSFVEDVLQAAVCPLVGDVVRTDPSEAARREHSLADEPRGLTRVGGSIVRVGGAAGAGSGGEAGDGETGAGEVGAGFLGATGSAAPHSTAPGSAVAGAAGPTYPFPSCAPIAIDFSDLSYDVQVQREGAGSQRSLAARIGACLGVGGQGATVSQRVLHGVSGRFVPGRMVALMGGSGAGKSTLLNLLSFRASASGGEVRYGGCPGSEAVARAQSGFVQQLDLFINHLSVKEHLAAQMRLRLPAATPAAERAARMELLINQLSLVRCRHTAIGTRSGLGGISGGEKKRLNVASEIVTMPPVLFADEPTTGLDSHMALATVRILRALADSGRTVVATVHQPSSKVYELFDEVLLLAEGHMVFAGDRLACVAWLRRLGFHCPPLTNPADFIIKVTGMPEGAAAREQKLREVAGWAERWREEGRDFLRAWARGGRSQFVASAEHIFAEQAKVAGLTPDPSLLSSCAPRSSFEEEREGGGKGEAERAAETVRELGGAGAGAGDGADASAGNGAGSGSATRRPCFPPCFSGICGSRSSGDTSTPGSPAGRLSWVSEVRCLTTRALQANKRDKMLVHARAGQTIVLGLFFGLLMFRLGWDQGGSRARLGGVYAQMLNQAMAGAFGVINTFGFEKPFIRREYESGLIRPSAYISAKMLADLPVQVVFPLVFVTIVYWLQGTRDDFARFLVMAVIVLLVANSAMSIGYLASALGESIDVAAIICNLTVLPFTVFGGFMVKLDEAAKILSWIQYLSFVKYGFENAAVNAFKGASVEVSPGVHVEGLQFINQALGFTDKYFGLYFGLLVLMVIVYRLFAAFAFSWSLKRRKENA